MANTSGSYSSFLGGVSQQDDSVRSDTQVSEADNAWLHAAMGAGKRPPAEFVQVLASNLDPMAYFHSIVRDDAERYIVAIEHRNIRVFDHITGREYAVNVEDSARDYLDTEQRQPWTVFKALTIADTTFIVQRNCRVQMHAARSQGHVTGSVQTLQDLPKTSSGTAQASTWVQGSGATPPQHAKGSIYHVTGTPQLPFDDYYVERAGSNTWVECAKPGIPYAYEARTMPHVLKRIPDDVHPDGFYFTFGPAEWKYRDAGDEHTNPEASFVGQTIQEVFLHRGRLGFLSSENVLMSEVDSYFNLWRTSVTQLLDSDPIDIAIATNGVAQLQHAVPFQTAVYVAASSAQYLLTAEPYMSAKNIKADPVNVYNCSPYIRPQLMGDSLYFVDDGGTHAVLREYYMDDLSVTGDAAETTAHVPRYLPGRCRCMCTCASGDTVLLSMSDGAVYAYAVRWSGDEKIQSAWSRWRFSGVGKIVHMHALHDVVYLVAEAPGGGVELLKLALSLNQQDSDATKDYTFMLDRLAVVEPVMQHYGYFTRLELPYKLDSLQGVTAIKTDAWADPGAYFDLTQATLEPSGQAIRIPGRHDGGTVTIGVNYTCKLSLTRPMPRNSEGRAILIGRTQIRDIEVAYSHAAYFEVEVRNHSGNHTETYLASHTSGYTARTLDSKQFALSSPVFHSGTRRFPVLSNAANVEISLVNALPYQCWFLSAQWRGLYTARTRL